MDEKDLLIAQLRQQNAALQQMIEDLQKQVKNLTEAVLLLRKNRFGSKSERTRNLMEEDGQLNLFNEIEGKRPITDSVNSFAQILKSPCSG